MRTSSLIGLAAAFTKKSKYRVLIVGIEFAYLAYKVLSREKKKKQSALPVPDDTTA